MSTDYGRSLQALVANAMIDGLRDPISDLIRGTAYVYLDYNAPETMLSSSKHFKSQSKDSGNNYGKPNQRDLNSNSSYKGGYKGKNDGKSKNFTNYQYKVAEENKRKNRELYRPD